MEEQLHSHFCWERVVEYGDLNADAHVDAAVLLRWLQEARGLYLRQMVLASSGEPWAVVVGENSVTCLSPIAYYNRVAIQVRVASVGASSFVFRYGVFKADQRKTASFPSQSSPSPPPEWTLCASGHTRMVCVDRQTRMKATIGPKMRAQFDSAVAANRSSSGSGNEMQHKDGHRKVKAPPANDLAWPLCWRHEVELRDLDTNVHVNNVAVFYWMAEATAKLLDEIRSELNKSVPPNEARCDVMVAAATIRYLSPMLYREMALVYTRLVRFNEGSITVEHKIMRAPNESTNGGSEGKVCYTGATSLDIFDMSKKVKVGITPALRCILERLQLRSHKPAALTPAEEPRSKL